MLLLHTLGQKCSGLFDSLDMAKKGAGLVDADGLCEHFRNMEKLLLRVPAYVEIAAFEGFCAELDEQLCGCFSIMSAAAVEPGRTNTLVSLSHHLLSSLTPLSLSHPFSCLTLSSLTPLTLSLPSLQTHSFLSHTISSLLLPIYLSLFSYPSYSLSLSSPTLSFLALISYLSSILPSLPSLSYSISLLLPSIILLSSLLLPSLLLLSYLISRLYYSLPSLTCHGFDSSFSCRRL